MPTRRSAARAIAPILLALPLACAAGCASAEIDAARGDIATRPVEHERELIPLTVVVERFQDRTPGGLERGAVDALTRSYAKMLDASRIFREVALARPRHGPGAPREGEPAPREPELRIRGTILRAELYRNHAWLASWGLFAAVTLGYGAFIGPVLGLPFASDTADFVLEVRAEAVDGKLARTYRTEWGDTAYLSIYSGEESQRGYCMDVRIPIAEAVEKSISALLEDHAVFMAAAAKRRDRS